MRALCLVRDESLRALLDEQRAYSLLRRARWPEGGARCVQCGGADLEGPWKASHDPACWRYHCRGCGAYFNDRTGTIFEASKLPLTAWLLAIYLHELGQSTAQIARELPCDYHTAHRVVWLIRERELQLQAGQQLQGEIEADETYRTAGHKGRRPCAGGGTRDLGRAPRRRGKKHRRGRASAAAEKPPVLGLVSRDGAVAVLVPTDLKQETVAALFRAHVAPGSTVYTDGAAGYGLLTQWGYRHETVNHTAKEYVRGAVHVNHCENLWSFWGAFLRPFRGVAQRNLPVYAGVFAFRRQHFVLGAFGRLGLLLRQALTPRPMPKRKQREIACSERQPSLLPSPI